SPRPRCCVCALSARPACGYYFSSDSFTQQYSPLSLHDALPIFGRLQYDYNGKYLFSAMFRRDASTHFGPENRVAYFPSFTAGWVDRKSTRLNSSHVKISYAVFCLKKKTTGKYTMIEFALSNTA